MILAKKLHVLTQISIILNLEMKHDKNVMLLNVTPKNDRVPRLTLYSIHTTVNNLYRFYTTRFSAPADMHIEGVSILKRLTKCLFTLFIPLI